MRAHGSYVRYVQGPDEHDQQPGRGCRCDVCREANRLYERERTSRIEPPYVGAARARAHLAELAAQGIGIKSVARLSGVSHGALSKLVYGNSRGRGPSKRIRYSTEQRILAVHAGLDSAPGGTRIPAGPSLVVVEELLRRGWTKVAIARAIGQGGSGLQVGQHVITRRNARALRDLLDRPVPPRLSRWGTPIGVPGDVVLEGRTHGLISTYQDGCRCGDCKAVNAEKRRGRRRQLAEEAPAPTAGPHVVPLVGDANMPWSQRAACKAEGVPTWMFYPCRGDNETLARAKAVCRTCPVSAECLAWALDNDEPGVWGGTSERQRQQMRHESTA